MWGLVVLGPLLAGFRQLQRGGVAPRFPAEIETAAAKIANSTMSPFCPGCGWPTARRRAPPA